MSSINSTPIFSQFSLRGVKIARKVAAGGQNKEQQGSSGWKTKTLDVTGPGGWMRKELISFGSREADPGESRDRGGNLQAVAAAQGAAGLGICTADDPGSCQ